jgi:ribonuclease P protein component
MLPRVQRIHTASQFRFIRGKGYRWQASSFLAYYVPSSTNISRLGVIVSTKVGSSVVRKRAARLLREAFILTQGQLRTPADIILIARPSIKEKTVHEVAGELVLPQQKFRG